MLNYSLVCSAYGEDQDSVRRGMQRIAEVAHRHGVPITWAVESRSVRSYARLLTAYHDQGGDEVLLMLDITPLLAPEETLVDVRQKAQDQVRMREVFPPYIEAERDRLLRAIPWAEPKVAGAWRKNEVLAPALQQVGFLGLWGYRWEQAEPEGIQDRGCPFGLFAIGRERPNGSGADRTDVVGIPQASVDLVGVLSGQVPYDASGELAHALPRGTARIPVLLHHQNRAWNACPACVQHLSAEMVGREEEGSFLPLLDAHLAFVTQLPDLQPKTLSAVVEAYRALDADAQWTAILAAGEEEAGTLFFYDHACQLVFQQGSLTPHILRNYLTTPFESRTFTEMERPELTRGEPARRRDQLMFTFEIESPKPMPYGLAIWGDYALLRLKETNAEQVLWIGSHLLLVRVSLQIGVNRVEVVLTI